MPREEGKQLVLGKGVLKSVRLPRAAVYLGSISALVAESDTFCGNDGSDISDLLLGTAVAKARGVKLTLF